MVCICEIYYLKFESYTEKNSNSIKFIVTNVFSFLNRSEFRQKLIGTLSGYLSQKYSILYTEIELELSANFLIEAKILNSKSSYSIYIVLKYFQQKSISVIKLTESTFFSPLTWSSKSNLQIFSLLLGKSIKTMTYLVVMV